MMRNQMSYSFTDPSLSDLEFAKQLMEAYDKEMANANPEDYEIDPIQLKKMNDLIEFFKKAAKDLGGKIESIDLNPSKPPNGITANFIVFDLFGDDIQRFCDVIRHCSAISMDVTVNDEISISCTIPGVFVHK